MVGEAPLEAMGAMVEDWLGMASRAAEEVAVVVEAKEGKMVESEVCEAAEWAAVDEQEGTAREVVAAVTVGAEGGKVVARKPQVRPQLRSGPGLSAQWSHSVRYQYHHTTSHQIVHCLAEMLFRHMSSQMYRQRKLRQRYERFPCTERIRAQRMCG